MADPGAAKRDLNALRVAVASTEEDVWITFYAGCLWWCRLAPGAIEEDATSKFRRTAGGWSDCDVHGSQLQIANILGILSQLQGFRGVICSVREANRLQSLLSAESSLAHQAVKRARAALTNEVRGALGELHWKDFETLVDLLFRQAGWRRLSMLGETMKFADLELEEPIKPRTLPSPRVVAHSDGGRMPPLNIRQCSNGAWFVAVPTRDTFPRHI